MNKSLKERIRDTSSLPTLPAAAICVLQLTQSETASMDELAAVISRDAALSSKILRAINSSFYGLEHQVSTVMQAVPLLGLHSVKALVLGFTLVNDMRNRRPRGFNHLNYWRRSMYAAAAARIIAKKVLPAKVEECFIAALLMDLGTLALDQMLGDEYSAIYEKAKAHSDLLILETHSLGMSHAEVGGLLGEHWKLPDVLKVPMAHHHGAQEVANPDLRAITEVVSLAGRCGDIFTDESPADTIALVRKIFQERYRVGPAEVDELLCEIGHKTSELASLFEVRVNEGVNYDGIMAQAAQRLTELQLLEQAGQPQEASNRRRAQRVRRDGKINVIPCSKGILARPLRVRLKDLSAAGIGLIHSDRLEPGTQFIVQLPGPDKQMKSLMYTVTRCDAAGGLFSVGAELTCVLRPESARPAAIPA